jgi:5S rRNA maturation endonuclease (ribonuclease M5)
MNRRNPEGILEFFGGIEDCLLIVEGKRDAKSLNTLGLKNILPISGRPLTAIVDKVAELKAKSLSVPEGGGRQVRYSDIIVLTDFDREGRHIAGRLSTLLRAHKIHPNQRLRSRIMNFGFNKIEDIKMDSILRMGFNRRIRGDDYVKTGTDVDKVRHKGVHKGKRRGGEA